MKHAIPAVVVAMICLVASSTAQTPTGKVGVDVTGNQAAQELIGQILKLSDGTYELKVDGGNVTIVPLTWITPDGPTPPPDDLTQRGKEIRVACLSITGDSDKELNTQKMAALYRQIKKTVDAGGLSGQQNIAVVVKGAQELLLGSALDAWSPVITKFGQHWAVMVQDGRPDGDYAAYLAEAADGLESTLVSASFAAAENEAINAAVEAAIIINSPGADQASLVKALNRLRKASSDRKAISPEMIELIIKLIMMIIDMFTQADPAFQPAVMPDEVPVPKPDGAFFRFKPPLEMVAA